MNKVILMGRLTRDPETRGEGTSLVTRYSLAVDRRFSRNEENNTDFINIVAFGKSGEFAQRYFKKGTKVLLTGRIQTGSYTNKDGQRVYTTDVIAEDQEFAESKNASGNNGGQTDTYSSSSNSVQDDGDFMNLSDGVKDDMPF
ncbi:MAG: single-stranded DNA-binding protein [Lachnospiraceae bacterium]|nr:single-stranded DNA-binding protein [Lachnospiraceae bacterium]